MTCGELPKSDIDFNLLGRLGRALDTTQRLSVFHGGRVDFSNESESEDNTDDTGRPQRPPTRTRAGQRTAERPWRSGAQIWRRGSDALEATYGTGFQILAQTYDALGFEDKDGLWVVVQSRPLGYRGPQLHFVIAFFLDQTIQPRAWAFEKIGVNARPMSLKHTNFPDASICAFIPDGKTWSPDDGMTALVDQYAVWAVKKLHRDHLGFWPGQQAGACAFYRRKEFVGSEWCGCQSGKRYSDCHQGTDFLVDEVVAENEFNRLYPTGYYSRAVPEPILEAARSRWKRLPQLRSVFA